MVFKRGRNCPGKSLVADCPALDYERPLLWNDFASTFDWPIEEPSLRSAEDACSMASINAELF